MKAEIVRHVMSILVVGALTAVLSLELGAQVPATAITKAGAATITVNDPRPMARSIDELERLCACAITYEDPRFSHVRDVVETRIGRNKERRTLIPRGGPFEFSHMLGQRVDSVKMRDILSSLMGEYDRTGYPGSFAVMQTGAILHVFPVASDEATAPARGTASLLDAPIAFPSEERTLSEALETVKRGLTDATGQRVLLGLPLNVFEGRRLVVGADLEPARSVLLRILEATGRRLSWRLLYDAAIQTYVLNIHVVPS